MMKSRIISGIIAVGYVVAAWFTADPETTLKVAIFLVLPLACIWFSDAMGGYTGAGMGHGAITGTSPGCLVALLGWVLLLLPLLIGLIGMMGGEG